MNVDEFYPKAKEEFEENFKTFKAMVDANPENFVDMTEDDWNTSFFECVVY